MTDLSFAVIGCGSFGSRRVNALRKIGARIACLVDINEEMVSKMARESGCDYYTDYREALMRKDFDCAIVATPNKFHAPISIAAMNSGKHVLCEKPLARSPEEAHAMVDAAKQNNVFLKTGSNLRYFSNVRKAKELVDGGAIGRPLFVRGWIGHDGKKVLHTWNVNKELSGGGTMLDNGAHILDLFRWFMGDFSECTGHVATLQMPIEVEDNGMGIFRADDGRMAFIQSSWTEWSGYMYMEVYGSEGSVIIDNRGEKTVNTGKWIVTSTTTLTAKDGSRQIFDYSTEPPQSYELELKDFISCLESGRQPIASGYDGMKVVEMVNAIYESSRTGRVIRL
ncbi:MAG: Gfo/Idh/MocA family oxidoreductase [Candidatus Hadarchaeum sp.]|uniref:Gfo/Idh/MocA family protein n=1 Tax=Candidatus Hadarchaeum sp. TaxID=2883567 RepID=UPI0031826BF7